MSKMYMRQWHPTRTLSWKIPWTEEPGRLQSMGSRRVGHDWATSLSLFTFMPWRRKWHPTPVLLPGKSHGRRSLVGYMDTTERLHFHFSLSCIGEGNGNPLQCSCLENPRDSGAWWAAIYGVAQSQTRLKRLKSSSSSNLAQRVITRITMQNPKFKHVILVEIALDHLWPWNHGI